MKIIFDKHPKNKRETAKKVLALVMVLYFLGAIFGGVMVWLTREGLEALFTYIGAPTATAIGFYCWKAKNENISKYSKCRQDAESEDNTDEYQLEEETDIP